MVLLKNVFGRTRIPLRSENKNVYLLAYLKLNSVHIYPRQNMDSKKLNNVYIKYKTPGSDGILWRQHENLTTVINKAFHLFPLKWSIKHVFICKFKWYLYVYIPEHDLLISTDYLHRKLIWSFIYEVLHYIQTIN